MIQRFQLYFPAELYLRLKDAAARHQTSIADFVRRAAEAALARESEAGPDPLDRIVGKASSRYRDLASRHDAYLYGLVKDAPAVRKRRGR